MEEKKWNDLTCFTTKFENLYESTGGKAIALKPLAKRIQSLERELYGADVGSMFDDYPYMDFKIPEENNN